MARESAGAEGSRIGSAGARGRPAPGELMGFARALALRAGEVTLRHFGEALTAETKVDGTPVTRADREAETLLREEIGRRYPDHSILGEEFGEEVGDEPVRWILDPIDGTRSFMKGVPLYAVLIGVEVAGDPVAGVVHLPVLGETVAAARGEGCRWWPSGGRSAPAGASLGRRDARGRDGAHDGSCGDSGLLGRQGVEFPLRRGRSRPWVG